MAGDLDPEWDRRLYLASARRCSMWSTTCPPARTACCWSAIIRGWRIWCCCWCRDGDLRREAAIKYPTATVAELQIDGAWSGLLPGAATLTRFIRPRDLDPALGPDA